MAISPKLQARYATQLATQQLPDGRTVYTSARPVDVLTDAQDVTIVADEDARSDIMAFNMYGTSLDWYKIVAANGNWRGSLFFTPGQLLTIPRK